MAIVFLVRGWLDMLAMLATRMEVEADQMTVPALIKQGAMESRSAWFCRS
jgi:hypothetical protein